MEPIMAMNGGNQELSADPISFARSYQLEALEKAMKQNTIVFLETGSGKTLIAIMLLRSYAHLLRKPSPFISVFLVPTVVLVTQQAEAITMHTDLKVGKYWGEMGVDFWDAATWKQQQDNFEVLVMTPAILLDALRHSFLKLDKIKVLIFDECHNARGKHPYACIMTEFYHRQLTSNGSDLPRIFGMTASPIKAKGSSLRSAYWKQIRDLENLMNSKVYTCVSESVLAEYIPFATPQLKFYNDVDVPREYFIRLENDLERTRVEYECSLGESRLPESIAESGKKKLSKVHSNFLYCMRELGILSALKAAESLASVQNDIFSWGELDASSENAIRGFCLDASKVFSACIPSGKKWSIICDKETIMNAGYLSSKVTCLFECLHAYRDLKDLRCIIFVERIITAVVLRSLLTELLPELCGWKTEYMAGNHSGLQAQSRKDQNKIVEEFRRGTVNIIVATSILEEGLDVQSCNLVIRFDPSATVCSFIQSRGRARKQNSDFIIMIKSRDASTLTRVKNYLASGDIMRKESLRHASLPCSPLELYDDICYQVEATGAIVTLTSSVSLLHFYCSRLPSDGYFKPYPRFVIDKELESCILYLPKSCPVPMVKAQANVKILKQLACLEACKQLHLVGALTDNLVPDIVEEESNDQESGVEYNNEQVQYLPPELISGNRNESETFYYCYLLELRENLSCNTRLRDLMLGVTSKFDFHEKSLAFDLVDDSDGMIISIRFVSIIRLTSEQVLICQRFQVTLLRVLLDHSVNKLNGALDAFRKSNSVVFDYLLLPATGAIQNPSIDWDSVSSVLLPSVNIGDTHLKCLCAGGYGQRVYTKSGLVCLCLLKNSLVCTPHNGYVYHIAGTLDGLCGNSTLELRGGEVTTYQKYYEKRHGVHLQFEGQSLLHGTHIVMVQNYLLKCRTQKTKESSNASVELPPELCLIIMSPISLATLNSFSYAPSIMHRIESLLLAANLKKMDLDHCTKNVNVPTIKVLEAITTKKCQEKFHLESLETLGDSFLKYAATQQLFKTYQSYHEGLLSIKRERIICNTSLCKLGCDRKIPGFIRNEPFDLKMWIIPGDNSVDYALEEHDLSPTKKIYSRGTRKVKSKTVADVVEALIGAYLSEGGEMAALSFMEWLGIKVDFVNVPYERNFVVRPERHVNLRYLESLLNYSFRDASFLVEALTHGSYMLAEIPRCYQRLEFLGDSVLDYLITVHLYNKYPGLSPGLLTDLRSASVNNDCYAQSAVKAGLYKHILHASQELQRQITTTVIDSEHLSLPSTFGWESETTLPKVLGDVIESLAGAILVDSNYNKDLVFQCIRPLLDPLVTLESLRLHPVRELSELCQKENYILKKPVMTRENGKASVMLEVEANGVGYKYSSSASDKKTAKKLACKGVLDLLKENMFAIQGHSSM